MTDLKELIKRLQEKKESDCRLVLSLQEEKILFGAVKEGDKQAKELFACCNLGLVFAIAKVFFYRMPPNAAKVISFQDLVGYGNIGLTTAMNKFNPERGKFSTYAIWWIMQAITKAINDRSREIRIPCHFLKKQAAILSAVALLYARYDREPTFEEIVEETELNPEDVKIALRPELILSPLSLNARVHNNDEKTELGDSLGEEVDFDGAVSLKEIKEKVRKVLATLSPREEFVLRSRFGINGDGNQEPKTLDQIAEVLANEGKRKLSRERIRQIEEKAKGKLRKKRELKDLVKN